ncbi:MAG TPA: pilus assembly protein PilM [Candidatus Polarisedimenticolia bacterium]|nr:pilus assembly protein PilM [Candidatus Polarisedimenticolia bacterium]
MSSSLLSFDLKNLKLPRWLTLQAPADPGPTGLKATYPPVAMDMGINHLMLARLAKSGDRKWSLSAYSVVEVPPDLLDSDFFRIKVKSAGQYQDLVAGAIRKEGIKTDKISVVVPDHLARVALLNFEELPRTRRELTALVRWRMKKAVPFKVEEAAVDYQVLPHGGNGCVVLAVLMPASILEEHESVFIRLGIHPGLVDLSSFSLAHLYRPVIQKEVPENGDFMIMNATTTFFTVMIFRAGLPIFYRCKTFGFSGDENGDASHRLIHREAQASLLYYQEKLQGLSLAKVYMRLVGHDPARVAALFEGAPVSAPPELIDVRRVVDVTGRIGEIGEERVSELLQRLAPAVGAALGRDA